MIPIKKILDQLDFHQLVIILLGANSLEIKTIFYINVPKRY